MRENMDYELSKNPTLTILEYWNIVLCPPNKKEKEKEWDISVVWFETHFMYLPWQIKDSVKNEMDDAGSINQKVAQLEKVTLYFLHHYDFSFIFLFFLSNFILHF